MEPRTLPWTTAEWEWINKQWDSLVSELYDSSPKEYKDSELDRGRTRSAIKIKNVNYTMRELKDALSSLRNHPGSCVPPTPREPGVDVDEFVRSYVVPDPHIVPLHINGKDGTSRNLTSQEIYLFLSGKLVPENSEFLRIGLRKPNGTPFSIPELLATYYLFWEKNCGSGGKAKGGSRHKTRKVHKQLQRRSSSKRVRRRRRSTRRRNWILLIVVSVIIHPHPPPSSSPLTSQFWHYFCANFAKNNEWNEWNELVLTIRALLTALLGGFTVLLAALLGRFTATALGGLLGRLLVVATTRTTATARGC